MAITAAEYLHQMQALLPQGPAWPRDLDADLARLLSAFAEEFARIDAQVEKLTTEADPRSTSDMITDWERVAGLPDSCVAEAGQTLNLAQRHAALVARLTTLGGQAKNYFIALAAALGYMITITEFRPFLAGQSCSGDAVTTDWQFAWQVNTPTDTVVPFRAGEGVAGEPLNSWGNQLLECVISRLKPAHTIVIFAYL